MAILSVMILARKMLADEDTLRDVMLAVTTFAVPMFAVTVFALVRLARTLTDKFDVKILDVDTAFDA